MNLWHGKLSDMSGTIIKKRVIAHNLASDLERGRKFPCSFTDIYLSNVFSYQQSYKLVQPFKTFNYFSSIESRRCVIRVLLYPRSFETKCSYCNGKFKDILKHFVYDCSFLLQHRDKMNNKLKMYNFPQSTINNIKRFVAVSLENKLWANCFAEFLTNIKFHKSSEEDHATNNN